MSNVCIFCITTKTLFVSFSSDITVHIANYFSGCRMQSRPQLSTFTWFRLNSRHGISLNVFHSSPQTNLILLLSGKACVHLIFSPNHLFLLLTINVLAIILFKCWNNIISFRILSSNLSLPNLTPSPSYTLTWTIMPYSFHLLNLRIWWLGWWCHHSWESIQLHQEGKWKAYWIGNHQVWLCPI